LAANVRAMAAGPTSREADAAAPARRRSRRVTGLPMVIRGSWRSATGGRRRRFNARTPHGAARGQCARYAAILRLRTAAAHCRCQQADCERGLEATMDGQRPSNAGSPNTGPGFRACLRGGSGALGQSQNLRTATVIQGMSAPPSRPRLPGISAARYTARARWAARNDAHAK